MRPASTMAWASNQGRSGGLVSLPGTSPARLSSFREQRRVNAARTPWTPTQPTPKQPQEPPKNTHITSYSMKPSNLLNKLKATASPDQPLVQEEEKDSGGTVVHQFSAGMFGLVVKPAFTSLSKNFS